MDVQKYPDYTSKVDSKWGWNASADISYFITKRFFVTVHISEGNFNYSAERKYDDEAILGDDNGMMTVGSVGLLAGYSLPITSWSNISGQIGFAQFNLLDEYYSTVYFPKREDATGYGMQDSSHNYHTVFSASIPVKFSVGFMPFKKMDVGFAKNIELGYTCGLDIEPDFGLFTFFYHGPQLSIAF
ncbi:hypothetical protein FACS1894182_09090 [Bacteroidia bacterium]|nr:hypothetical protein FACS1894182_09090 [Bacteroidia bacterium]